MLSAEHPASDLRRLQDDWDAEARHAKIAALRNASRPDIEALDRQSAALTYAVAIIGISPFVLHGVLFALRVLA